MFEMSNVNSNANRNTEAMSGKINKTLMTAALLATALLLAFSICGCAQGDKPQDSQSSNSIAFDEKTSSGNDNGNSPSESSQSGSSASSPVELSEHAIVHEQDDRLTESSGANDVTPKEKVVYLTFDDGPSGQTQRILDTLDKFGIKGTWFVPGSASNLDAIPEIWNRGHQIGLHSNTHKFDQVYANKDSFFNEMDTIASTVNEYIGVYPKLIRFPGGSVGSYESSLRPELLSGISDRGWHYYDWNVSIGDSTIPMSDVDTLMENIRNGAAGCHSCCVLMHDFDGKSTTADALEQVIEYFIDEGFKFDYLTEESYGYHF